MATVKAMKKGMVVLLIVLSSLFLPPVSPETTMEEWYHVGDALIIRNTYTGEDLYRITIYDVDLINEKVIFKFQALPQGSPVMYTVHLKERLYGDTSHGFDVEPLDVFMGISGDVSVRLRFYLDDGYTVVSDTATLRISSDPSDAAVYIDGEYRGKTPLTVELPSGTHEIVVAKEGYRPYNTTVVLETGEYKTLYASLERIVGKLKVESTPSNAKVYVDGDYIGRTPITYELPPGTYRVKLVLDGYFEYSTTVTVKASDTKEISVNLKPKPGKLRIKSEPSGAEVYVNGTYIGKTPIDGYSLNPGKYWIEVKLPKYQVYEKRITVVPGQEYLIHAQLTPSWGVLKVTSTPSGAEVYINDENAGRTPLELQLDPGTYTVRVTLDGYEEYEDRIEVRAGETTGISASLTPVGYVTVTSEPSGARVYLDGTYIGNTPITEYKVQAGAYEVTVEDDGYQAYKTSIKIEAGETKEINVELTPLETVKETKEASETEGMEEATISPNYGNATEGTPSSIYIIGAAVMVLGLMVGIKLHGKPNETKLLEREFNSIRPSMLPEEAVVTYREAEAALHTLKKTKGSEREKAIKELWIKLRELKRTMQDYQDLKRNLEEDIRKMLSQGISSSGETNESSDA